MHLGLLGEVRTAVSGSHVIRLIQLEIAHKKWRLGLTLMSQKKLPSSFEFVHGAVVEPSCFSFFCRFSTYVVLAKSSTLGNGC